MELSLTFGTDSGSLAYFITMRLAAQIDSLKQSRQNASAFIAAPRAQ